MEKMKLTFELKELQEFAKLIMDVNEDKMILGRCKDCRFWQLGTEDHYCSLTNQAIDNEMFYCADWRN